MSFPSPHTHSEHLSFSLSKRVLSLSNFHSANTLSREQLPDRCREVPTTINVWVQRKIGIHPVLYGPAHGYRALAIKQEASEMSRRPLFALPRFFLLPEMRLRNRVQEARDLAYKLIDPILRQPRPTATRVEPSYRVNGSSFSPQAFHTTICH